MTTTLGENFARAVAEKDEQAMRQLLHPDLDFRAMTPRRVWDASDSDGVLDALHQWFGQTDEIEAIDALDVDSFADRERVGYRLRVATPTASIWSSSRRTYPSATGKLPGCESCAPDIAPCDTDLGPSVTRLTFRLQLLGN